MNVAERCYEVLMPIFPRRLVEGEGVVGGQHDHLAALPDSQGSVSLLVIGNDLANGTFHCRDCFLCQRLLFFPSTCLMMVAYKDLSSMVLFPPSLLNTRRGIVPELSNTWIVSISGA